MKSNNIIRYNQRRDLSMDNMDNILKKILTEMTLGEICKAMETSANVKNYTACRIIVNAISECDVGLIKTIIQRIDGGIPKAEDMENYSNLIGKALEEVMEEEPDERFIFRLNTDTGIKCMAKAIVMAALQKTNNNVAKRKDRQMAADILLSRTGGLKNEPQIIRQDIIIEKAEWE